MKKALSLIVLACVGCAWIAAHDPSVHPPQTKDCSGLGEERCGVPSCCDAWNDYHCNPMSARCEWQPPLSGARAVRDAGIDR